MVAGIIAKTSEYEGIILAYLKEPSEQSAPSYCAEQHSNCTVIKLTGANDAHTWRIAGVLRELRCSNQISKRI